jgi:hypothetical protein
MRPYRELWLWLGGALLTIGTTLALIALAYFTKLQNFSLYTSWQMLIAVAAAIAAFFCFLGAILGWSFPPWAKLDFPNIKIEILRNYEVSPDRKAIRKNPVFSAHLLAYRARIINMETEQNASLTIYLYLKRVSGPSGLAEEICDSVPDMLDLSDRSLTQFSLSPISMPCQLPPRTAIGGDLLFTVNINIWNEIAQPRQGRVVVQDHVSEKMMEIRFTSDPGTFTTADMTPSDGEIGFFELQP